jgi:hypothetical protein
MPKTFTLAQANALLPELKTMLATANQEITKNAEILANAYAVHENCEQAMSKIKAIKVTSGDSSKNKDDNLAELRDCRLNFQSSIEALSQAKQNYIQTLNFWLEEISQTGVILRDIKSGLLDFPARMDDFEYYLCWQANEDDIQYWHMMHDGFIGRRPLAVLSEYS